MWDIVWVSPQGHRSVSVSNHFLLQALQCPCSVQKRFSRAAETTVTEGGQNPVAGLWGRTLGENWPPEPTSSYASIDFGCQLVASPATMVSWMLIVAAVGWGYQAGFDNCHAWQFSLPACQWQQLFVCSNCSNMVTSLECCIQTPDECYHGHAVLTTPLAWHWWNATELHLRLSVRIGGWKLYQWSHLSVQ